MNGLPVFVLLFAVALAAGLPSLGERDFWPPDEARYGGVALEQSRGDHHPLVPHLNGKLYPDKPAFYFLAIQGSARLLNEAGEIDEAASRLPSVLGGALLVALVGCWVATVVGPGTGVLAGLVLLGFGLFSWQLRYVQMDMLLAATCGVMMAAFWRTWNGGSVWWCTVGFVALTAGIAVKGPMALLVFAAVVVWACVSRRPRAIFNLGSLVGLVIMSATVGGALAHIGTVPDGAMYVDHLLGRHVVERATRGLAHEKPWYAYVGTFPGSLLPLTPLLLLGLQSRVRGEIATRARPLIGFAIVWLLVVLIVASTQPGKRSVYLIPIFPAAAILIACLVDAARRAEVRWPARYGAAVGVLGCVIGGACLAIGYDSGAVTWIIDRADAVSGDRLTLLLEKRAFDPAGDAFRDGALLAGRWMTPFALFSVILGLTWGRRAAVGACALLTAVMIGAGCIFIAPELDPAMSRRPVAEALHKIEADRGTEAPIGYVHHLDEGVAFYVGRPCPEIPGQAPGAPRLDKVKQKAEMAAAVAAALAPEGALLIAREDCLRDFGLEPATDYREVTRIRIGRHRFIILESPR